MQQEILTQRILWDFKELWKQKELCRIYRNCIFLLIKDKILKKNYIKTRRPLPRLNKKSVDKRALMCEENPLFGNIVCRCEKISEGEIVDAIHRSCGARTIKGVKKRVRPGFGKCQGGFYESIVLKILARELNLDPLEIVYGKQNAYILSKKTKGE